MKSYRVHVHDHNDQGRWLASADFRRRPARTEIAAAFPMLRVPGRYEIRLNPVVGEPGAEISGWSWLQDAAPERVIFRKWNARNGGGIIALFPDLPEDRGMITCFEHVGQHGDASAVMVVSNSRPASPEEYAALKRELESPPYGYQLAVIQRTPGRQNQPYNIQARSSG